MVVYVPSNFTVNSRKCFYRGWFEGCFGDGKHCSSHCSWLIPGTEQDWM